MALLGRRGRGRRLRNGSLGRQGTGRGGGSGSQGGNITDINSSVLRNETGSIQGDKTGPAERRRIRAAAKSILSVRSSVTMWLKKKKKGAGYSRSSFFFFCIYKTEKKQNTECN